MPAASHRANVASKSIPVTFRAIAMNSNEYCGSQIRVKAKGLRWLSRNGAFGSEIVMARDDSLGCSVQFVIGRHQERKGAVEAPSKGQLHIIERLWRAGVLLDIAEDPQYVAKAQKATR